jgi:hypothetical protein
MATRKKTEGTNKAKRKKTRVAKAAMRNKARTVRKIGAIGKKAVKKQPARGALPKRPRELRRPRLSAAPARPTAQPVAPAPTQRLAAQERHLLEQRKDQTPESAARDEGFPEGWSRHVGGDEEYYDMWIDRYSRRGVTIWKERGDFWYWQPPGGPERRESLSKFDAIQAAEQWLNEFDRG